jgi:hypothetical protein
MIIGITLGVLLLVIVLVAHSIVDDLKKSDDYKLKDSDD